MVLKLICANEVLYVFNLQEGCLYCLSFVVLTSVLHSSLVGACTTQPHRNTVGNEVY